VRGRGRSFFRGYGSSQGDPFLEDMEVARVGKIDHHIEFLEFIWYTRWWWWWAEIHTP